MNIYNRDLLLAFSPTLPFYSAPGNMVDVSSFICGTYIHKSTYMNMKILGRMAFLCSLAAMFVSGVYMPIGYEADGAVGCVMAHMCSSVRSICPHSMKAV